MSLSLELVQKIEENDPHLTNITIDDPDFKVEDVQRLKKLLKLNEHITEISIKRHGILPGQYDNLLDLVSSCPQILSFSCKLPFGVATSIFNQALAPVLASRKEPKSGVILQNDIKSTFSLKT